MIHLTRAAVRRWLDALLHVDDTPQRTAAAFAVGVFFGFSPLLGLHTILGLACAFLFDLNRVAVLLGVYSNLPWILAPWYTFATMAGAKLLGHSLPAGFGASVRQLFELSFYQEDFWRRIVVLLRPFLWPYAVGSTIGAGLLAGVAYRLALAFVLARRKHLPAGRWHLLDGKGR